MTQQKNTFSRNAPSLFAAASVPLLLAACQFDTSGPIAHDPFEPFQDDPLTQLVSDERTVIFERPDALIAVHGNGCAESEEKSDSKKENAIRVEQSFELPDYADNATVFLNGWKLEYDKDDQKVAGLGTFIGRIGLDNQTLSWQAAGVISDKDFKDGYNWCYYYTILAWSDSQIDALVDHNDEDNLFIGRDEETTTARSVFPSYLENDDFASGGDVAVLPRGYGFVFKGNAHNLLQVAYNLEHGERYIEAGKQYRKNDELAAVSLPDFANRVESGYVSWETYAIFKDNRKRRKFAFGEIVSGLGGNDVQVIEPPFSIVPIEDSGGPFTTCISSGDGLRTKEVVIENVPFESALPVLTGWDVGYFCDDNHVTEIGAWIDEIEYEKDPDSPAGTLRYQAAAILRDKDFDPEFRSRHNVHILGVGSAAADVTSERRIDLVPGHRGDAVTCRLDNQGRLLVIAQNQGNDNAAASHTSVIFDGGSPESQETAPIPAGGSVNLFFDAPQGCFDADCSFSITVDSEDELSELNENNNTAEGICIG